jgi:hypothetical protein
MKAGRVKQLGKPKARRKTKRWGKAEAEAATISLGIIKHVTLAGHGQNSGQIEVRLETDEGILSLFVRMGTPADAFFKLLRQAVTAMWAACNVEIKHVLDPGSHDQMILEIDWKLMLSK